MWGRIIELLCWLEMNSHGKGLLWCLLPSSQAATWVLTINISFSMQESLAHGQDDDVMHRSAKAFRSAVFFGEDKQVLHLVASDYGCFPCVYHIHVYHIHNGILVFGVHVQSVDWLVVIGTVCQNAIISVPAVCELANSFVSNQLSNRT